VRTRTDLPKLLGEPVPRSVSPRKPVGLTEQFQLRGAAKLVLVSPGRWGSSGDRVYALLHQGHSGLMTGPALPVGPYKDHRRSKPQAAFSVDQTSGTQGVNP
jgi:hypothetical protein